MSGVNFKVGDLIIVNNNTAHYCKHLRGLYTKVIHVSAPNVYYIDDGKNEHGYSMWGEWLIPATKASRILFGNLE